MMRRWYDEDMRTTVDLPDDLHEIAKSLARDRSQSFSEAVVELMRRGLGSGGSAEISYHSRSGFPTISLGRPITSEDVRSLEDDE